MTYPATTLYDLAKFQPLPRILSHDDFDTGPNGWVDLTPNFTEPDFDSRDSPVNRKIFGPCMLSSNTYRLVGTHGSMNGTYSLKVATRKAADPYTSPSVSGGFGQAIKRLSVHRPRGLLQFEMWFTYKAEQDRPGLGENDVRAFGFMFDLQDAEYRCFPAVRYLNAVHGEMKQHWQYAVATEVSDEEWTYGHRGEWHVRGIDPQWFGRRYPDGTTDGFRQIPGSEQKLCFNESDDKINWLYFRFLFDMGKRQYVELQSGEKAFDMRGLSPTLVQPYERITSLLNPSVWIETDADRRSFLYLDSVLLSCE